MNTKSTAMLLNRVWTTIDGIMLRVRSASHPSPRPRANSGSGDGQTLEWTAPKRIELAKTACADRVENQPFRRLTRAKRGNARYSGNMAPTKIRVGGNGQTRS